MPSKSWLFLRDGDSDPSLDSAWDNKTDEFMHKTLGVFKSMHEGNCCDWNANLMQQSVESLHFYSHLAIVKRTGGTPPLVKAVQHGTSWIPYGEDQVQPDPAEEQVEPLPAEKQVRAEPTSLMQQRLESAQASQDAMYTLVQRGLTVAQKNLYDSLQADAKEANGKPVEAETVIKAFYDAVGQGTQAATTDPDAAPTLEAAGQYFASLLVEASKESADPEVKQQVGDVLIRLGMVQP